MNGLPVATKGIAKLVQIQSDAGPWSCREIHGSPTDDKSLYSLLFFFSRLCIKQHGNTNNKNVAATYSLRLD